jgi:hypothetical protein
MRRLHAARTDVTTALAKNKSSGRLDLTEEWEKLSASDGGKLAQGCIVVNKAFAIENAAASRIS